jgi:hypothetical protein
MQPRTIKDALLDASTTEANGLADRMPHFESQAGRLIREERGITIPVRSKMSSSNDAHSSLGSPPSETDTRRRSLQIAKPSLSPSNSIGSSDYPGSLRHRSSALGLLGKGENKALVLLLQTLSERWMEPTSEILHDPDLRTPHSLSIGMSEVQCGSDLGTHIIIRATIRQSSSF